MSNTLPRGLVTEAEAIRLGQIWIAHGNTQNCSVFGDKNDGGNLVSVHTATSPCKEENTTMDNNTNAAVDTSSNAAAAAAPAELENHLVATLTALTNNVGHAAQLQAEAVKVQAELLAEMKADRSIKAKAIDAGLMITAVGFGVAGGFALFEFGIKPLVKGGV